jgi:hypothetical protein
VAKELQTSHLILPLFTPCPNARNSTGHGQDQFVIKTASKSQLHLGVCSVLWNKYVNFCKFDFLIFLFPFFLAISSRVDFFRFLGQLMGMAIRTGVTMPFNLSALFWKQLVGLPLTESDIMGNPYYHDV